jgi:hypothetical protein
VLPALLWSTETFSGVIFVIVNTFFGLGSIPHREIIDLSNFSKGTLNHALLRVQHHFKFTQVVEGVCQVRDESFIFLSLSDHVINVCFNVGPKLTMETFLYAPLVRCPSTFESEQHYCIIKSLKWSDEGYLNLIFDLEGNLIIP